MTAFHADVLVRLGVLALAAYALVGQVGKPGLRLLVRWRRHRAGALSRLAEEAIRWATRAGAAVHRLPRHLRDESTRGGLRAVCPRAAAPRGGPRHGRDDAPAPRRAGATPSGEVKR